MIRSHRRRGPPPPRAAGADTYLAAYAQWREAEALLSGDVRAGKAAAARLLGDAAVAAR